MPIARSGILNQSQIERAVRKAEKALAPDVVHIRYGFADDWSGDPAVYFRVLLTDAASRDSQLRQTVQRVSRIIGDQVRPEEFGLLSYINFRSASEQKELREDSWT